MPTLSFFATRYAADFRRCIFMPLSRYYAVTPFSLPPAAAYDIRYVAFAISH